MPDFDEHVPLVRSLSFDCYGTLIDWESGIVAALKPILNKKSASLPSDDQILQIYAELESEIQAGKYLPYRTILQLVLEPFRELVNAEMFRRLMEASLQTGEPVIEEVERKATRLLHAAAQIANPPISNRSTERGSRACREAQQSLQSPIPSIAHDIRRKLEALLRLTTLPIRFPLPRSRKYKWAIDYLTEGLANSPTAWPTLLGWLFTHALGKVADEASCERTSRSWIDEWLLGKVLAGALQDLGLDESEAWQAVGVIKLLIHN